MILIKRRLPVNPGRWSVSAHRRVAHVSHTLVSTLRIGADASRQDRARSPDQVAALPLVIKPLQLADVTERGGGRERLRAAGLRQSGGGGGKCRVRLMRTCTPEPQALRRGRVPSPPSPVGLALVRGAGRHREAE